eukprot:7552844-Karenia_brevis.AAC.1
MCIRDRIEVVPDVNLENPDVAAPDDLTLNYRRMTAEQSKEEANSIRHKMCHFPHNPYCKGCREGNIMQRRFARTGEKEDDGLPA